MTGEPEVIIEPMGGAEAAPQELPAEDRALTMGWVPLEQFKGDPSRWVDAETFVKRGEEFLPFLKAANKRLEKELDTVKKSVKEFAEFHSKTEARAYERAMRDLEARQAAATEAGDVEAVREITQEIVTLGKDVKAPTDEAAEAKALLDSWIAENSWYTKDAVMRGAAFAIADELAAEGIKDGAQLAEVAKRIKAEFPHKFENAKRREPGAVEGSTQAVKRGKGRADLPADARAAMDRWVKQGLITEAQYCKDYFA